jgi:adenine-specific DNA-methyltransferase
MEMDKLKMQSPNLVDANIARIAEMFPNCITEAKDENGMLRRVVDFDQLRQELSASLVEGPRERYTLSWPGKNEAILTANAPIAKTLRPCEEESVDFENTKNLYIEGDNLDVLKLLQETYLNKVMVIYIDQPYNTGNDFIYEDDFAEDTDSFLIRSNQKDDSGNRLVANTEANGRFHSDWLTMMYPRLKLARNLLREDGVIFISIGSDEVDNIIKVCNEVFGAENKISICARLMKTGGNKGRFFSPNIEYVVIYAKNIEETGKFRDEMEQSLIDKVYTQIETKGERAGQRFRAMGLYQSSLDARANQRYYVEAPDGELLIPPGESFPVEKQEGAKVVPKNKSEGVWRWTYERYLIEKNLGNIKFQKTNNDVLVNSENKKTPWNVNTKIWLNDRQEEGQLPNDFIQKYENRHSAKELKEIDIPFDFAKPVGLIKFFLKIVEYKANDIVLDFFAGSSTTAHAAMQQNAEDGGNRKFIMVQLPEPCDEKSEAFKAGYKTIAEIGKERIRRAGKKIKEESPMTTQNLDIGFRVFKVDTSNMKDVYYAPDELKQENMELFKDPIKPDRRPEDLLFQVFLDWGLDLTLPIAKETIDGKKFFIVDTNALIACFDSGITEELVKKLAKHKPLRAVFRDDAFGSDSVKINVEQIFKLLSPATEVKSI